MLTTKAKLIITGYIRRISNRLALDIIVYEILLFYSSKNTIPLTIFNHKFNNMTKGIKNIVNLTTNQWRQFYTTTDNEVFIFGDSERSFGLGDSENAIPNLTKHYNFINNKSVNLISRGAYNYHSFIYTINNELYGFGRNDYSQLGISIKYTSKPILINYKFNSILIQIECGYYHSLFLTENGKLYGCGNNGSSRLGIKDDYCSRTLEEIN